MDRDDFMAEYERAIQDHDPRREPYASMTREEIFALMQAKESPESFNAYEYERLNQYFLDKLSLAELKRVNFTEKLSWWLVDECQARGIDQVMHCRKVATEAAR